MTKITVNKGTFRLLKKEPSFKDGMASLIDMSPNQSHYNIDKTEKEADTNSLRADWYTIGNDLWDTIQKYESKSKQQTTA